MNLIRDSFMIFFIYPDGFLWRWNDRFFKKRKKGNKQVNTKITRKIPLEKKQIKIIYGRVDESAAAQRTGLFFYDEVFMNVKWMCVQCALCIL